MQKNFQRNNRGPNRGNRRFSQHGQSSRPRQSAMSRGTANVRRIIADISTPSNQAEAQAAAPVIKHKFADFALADSIKQNIERKGYVTPTPIQDQTIPLILEGKDVVGIANTGTGKSAAFLLPLIDKVIKNKAQRVLIIAPTRELVVQLDEELRAFTRGLGIWSVTCIGGMSINAQMQNLRRPHQFIIATPGRLRDLVDRNAVQLNRYSTIVLDEVDRMLDMGFVHAVRQIVAELPTNRHSLFFSATLTSDVERIMRDFVKDYVKITVKTTETNTNIAQDVIVVKSPEDKIEKLKELIESDELSKAIIFVRTKHRADRLFRALFKDKYQIGVIHGDKGQGQRQRTIQDFKNDKINLLVATDIVARGIDIKDISHVINFDVPATDEDYVHRIGRTGRSDNKGIAITFLEEYDSTGYSDARHRH